MNVDEIVTVIRTVPIFHSLEKSQLEQLARAADCREIEKKQVLIEPGQENRELFVILEGEFQLYLHRKEIDYEKSLGTLFPGDYFGAIAVLTGRSSLVSVRALTAGRAIVLRERSITELFDRSPSFGKAVCRSLAALVEQNVEQFGYIPFAQLESFAELASAVKLLPSRVCRVCKCLAVERLDDHVKVAMVDPSDTRARAFIAEVLRHYYVDFVAVAEEDFSRHAPRLLDPEPSLAPPDREFESLTYTSPSGDKGAVSRTKADELLRRVLVAAIRGGASDVHLEPGEVAARVRLRIDGKMLQFAEHLAMQEFKHLISRLKVIAELDITGIRRPQDGRFTVEADDRRVEFRVSSLPCHGGEKIVLRLIAPNPDFENLPNLILSQPVAMFAQEIFQSPSGLVLVTGPTGAGKTTTLYAALHAIEAQNRTLNIVTIEDPIEYNLEFATQVQVNRELGLGFSNVLRSVLRQDPDVILVGEIRDAESAALALEAATTGHLVLSSLHTYSALETVVRLLDLQAKPYLLASALKGVISQQLVPRLCPGYTEAVPLEDHAVQRMKALGVLEPDWEGALQRGKEAEGGPPGGEAGRVGVYEVLAITQRLRDLVDQSAPLSDLEAAFDPQCFVPMRQYCRFLLLEGLVAPEQIERLLPKTAMAS